MPKLKVLICGGGIAGNALALSLSRLNHDVTLVERVPNLRSTGLQLDLRGHGIQVLQRMGLEEAFRAKTVKEEGLQFVDKSGKIKAYFPANRSGKGVQSFSTDFEIMRGDFVQLLHDAAAPRTTYLFGTCVERFEQNDGFVDVWFANGRKDRFDLLVGADGQGSHIRKMMLGSAAADGIHFLGQYTGYFTVAQEAEEGEKYIATGYITTRKRFVLTRRHNPHHIQVYLSCDSEQLKDVPRGDVKREKQALAEIFEGAGWRTQEFVRALDFADDFYLERPGVVKLNSWSDRRVVLVGDAAYCPTANTGMGTTSSLVGAYVLAGEIASHCASCENKDQIQLALAAYEQKFRPFMDQVQHGVSEDSNNGLIPTSATGIFILNIVIGVAAFFRLDMLARFVLRESVRDWSLPEYRVLVNK